MEQKIKLKQLEKNTVAVIFQTGIVDIGIGLVWVVSSLAMIYDDIRYYIDILFVVPIIFIILSSRYITSPRMGTVKFAKKRMKRNKWFIATVTVFLVTMVILTFTGGGQTNGDHINGRWIVSGIIFIICTAIGYFLYFQRMYIYAFLLVGAFNLNEEIRDHPGIISDGAYVYLFTAIVLIIIGCIYLIRFLKKYPKPDNLTYDK